jgi:hypothetical protein
MKLVSRYSIALFLAASVSIFVSCKKDKSDDSQPAITEAEAEEYSLETMEAESGFDDLQDISMTAADEEALASAARADGTAGRPFPFLKLKLRIGINAQITVTPDDNTYPKTVTIDFGNGDNCPDGRFRKGKIIITISAPVREPGSVVTIRLQDYQVGRIKIEGTKVITNLSANGNIKFSVQVSDATVTWPNGRGYTYEKLKYITQTAGGTTDDIMDDVYAIEGNAKTTFKNGVEITLATSEALIKKVTCPWITEGVLQAKVRKHEFLLDYKYPANGDCDNKALLKWNNKEKIVVIP